MKTLHLDTSKLLDFSYNLKTSTKGIIGQTYVYDLSVFLKGAQDSGQNIDQFITYKIAEQLLRKAFKTPVVFFYAPYQHQLMISSCMKGQKSSFEWLMSLPGYIESGQNFVHNHAEPFLYWDGQAVYRILKKPDDYQMGSYLICDFGSLVGLYTETTTEDIYRQIRANPIEEPFYSTIPRDSLWAIDYQGKEHSIQYAFYEVMKPKASAQLPHQEQLVKTSQTLSEPVHKPEHSTEPGRHKLINWEIFMKNRQGGYFQQCSSCDWVGAEMKVLVDHCPVCGSQSDPNIGYKAGGLLVWMMGSEMFLGIPGAPNFQMMIQAADLPDVIALMEHWRYHPLNPNPWFE